MIRASIRRPVAVAMIYASVALLGVAAWRNIPVEYLPDASFPQLTLEVRWPGSSPETIEAFATSPVEATIQQLKGVERITSTTQEGLARIVVAFQRDVDMDFVRLDLSERLASVEDELPEGVQRPILIRPYVPQAIQLQATRPFMSYTFTGPFMVEALHFHLEEIVIPELRQIKGVSDVEITGGRNRLLEIELNEDRIASLGLTPQAVGQAVSGLSYVRDAGATRRGDLQWVVTIRSGPVSARDVREAILPLPGSRSAETPVRVQDVAEVRDTFEEPTSHYRINRGPAVNVIIHKEREINAVRLADQIQANIAELEARNPPGSQFILTYNQADDIRRELTDLRQRAAISGVVVFLVLLGFLRSFRTTAVVFSTIVFSILITLNLVYFGGFSLNIMTLMGIALGFGIIVDNAIVVLENVYRIWQEGADAVHAVEKGSRDVVLPIVASTATTMIVFLPFVYLQGELRIYYLPLAIVVGLTQIASLFVGFTFVPALMVRLLGKTRKRKAREAAGAPGTNAPAQAPTGVVGTGAVASGAGAPFTARGPSEPFYIRFYSGLLTYTLRFPWTTVVVATLCFVGTWVLFDKNVPRGRLFGGGTGLTRSFIDIRITMPRGSDLARMDELTQYFEERLATMPEVEKFEARVNNGMLANIQVTFPEELEYTPVPLVIEESLRAYGLGFTGAEVQVRGQGPAFYGGGGASLPNYRITLFGYNYEKLADIAEDLGRRLSRFTRVQEVNTNASGNGRDRLTEFVAVIDRDATARHGITVQEATALVRSVAAGASGRGQVVLDGEPVLFEVKLEGYRQADLDDLAAAVVTTSRGRRVPLGELIDVQERNVLTSIIRENQQYQRVVAYEFRGPNVLGDTIRNAAVRATVLPAGYTIQTSQASFISEDDARQINLVLLVSIGLIFMVTATLFESIRQPLVVLLAVPMALIGVFLCFFFLGATFTREAYIGVIMMGGIVVNNAILLVDHINRVRAETSLNLFDALIRATLERVRPILMTTATTVLGLLPLVLFMPAADARIWNALTYSLIGGLLSSTIFVLTTTPCLYLLFERIGRREGTPEWAEVHLVTAVAGAGGDQVVAGGVVS